jgi:hypothetical protein
VAGHRIQAVRWPVWEDLFAEGLLLEADGCPMARVNTLYR